MTLSIYNSSMIPAIASESQTHLYWNELRQGPITRSLQLPHIPVFTDRSIFGLNLARIQIPTGTSVTDWNHKHGLMLTWCRHVHVRPHCFVLTEACSFRLELAYFAWKISKNRLVCKNAVASAYQGSCRLLLMGSWLRLASIGLLLYMFIHYSDILYG